MGKIHVQNWLAVEPEKTHSFQKPCLVQDIANQYGFSDRPFTIRIRDRYILRAEWSTCEIGAETTVVVEYALGGRDTTRIIAQLALLVAVAVVASIPGVNAAIPALLSLGGNLLINAVIPPALPRTSGLERTRDPTPTVGGAGNRARLGQPVPSVYGTVKYTPDLETMPYTEFENNNQYYYIVLCLGHGYYHINQIWAGSTILSQFNVSTWALLEPTEVLPSGFHSHVYTNPQITGLELEEGGYTPPFAVCPPLQTVTSIAVDLQAPSGLYYVRDGESDPIRGRVNYEIQYRTISDDDRSEGNWATVTSGMLSSSSGTEYNTKSAGTDLTKLQTRLRWSIKFNVPEGRYQVRVRYTNFVTSGTTTTRVDRLNWSNLRGYMASTKGRAHETWSKLAIKILATPGTTSSTLGQISVEVVRRLRKVSLLTAGSSPVTPTIPVLTPGGSDLVEVSDSSGGPDLPNAGNTNPTQPAPAAGDVPSVIPTGDPNSLYIADKSLRPLIATNSIAQAVLDILTNKDYGLGLDINRDIDVYGLLTLDQLWYQRGDEFNYVFTSETLGSTAAAMALEAGRTRFYYQNGIIRFGRDQNEIVPSFTFSLWDMKSGSYRYSANLKVINTANKWSLKYYDKIYRRERTVTVSRNIVNQSREVIKEFAVPGITNRTQAFRELLYRIEEAVSRTQVFEFETTFESLSIHVGASAVLSHFIPMFGHSSEVVNYNLVMLEIDLLDDIIFESGNSYVAYFKSVNGTPSTTVPITRISARKYRLATWPSEQDGTSFNPKSHGDYGNPTTITIGTANDGPIKVIVTGLEPSGDGYVKVTAIEDNARVHISDLIVQKISPGFIKLDWSSLGAGVQYEISIVNNANPSDAITVQTTAITYTRNNLSIGGNYRINVSATNLPSSSLYGTTSRAISTTWNLTV